MLVRCSLLALLLSSVFAKSSGIRGLDPQLASKYVPDASGNFLCLDGSLSIPFSRVNDDYCDCPDGSDEPGTSACNNGTFYCANRGHIPARIPSSKVNNGVCDLECCDGSDEYGSKACPDRCLELGEKAREEERVLALVRERGGRRKAELVGRARELRVEKAGELREKEGLLAEAEAALARAEELKSGLEEKEGERARAREGRASELRESRLPELVAYRRFLSRELHRMRAHRDALILLLRSVRTGHNPEYSDAAVSRLIEEYAVFTDAYPYLEAAALENAAEGSKARVEREAAMDRDEGADDVDFEKCRSAIDTFVNERETLSEDIATLSLLLAALRDGYNKNYHDLQVKAAVVGFADYEAARERDLALGEAESREADIDGVRQRVAEATAALDALVESPPADSASATGGDNDGKELADARSAYWAAQSKKNTLSSDVSDLKTLLYDTDLGPHDVYLAVKGECVSLDTGEYTYEVCLLDRASQISNKDQSRQDLGAFAGFAATGNGHRYEGGAKCWNGPERSLKASFACSDEITVLGITEPEKCEYIARMTGPFACDDIIVGGEPVAAVQQQPLKSPEHDEL
ncbi:hypothetical protein IWW37_005515 [Coemansia sp. RSA 2050]|nr:hypothetical protein IWW37_005515 [Coemansia sp. RSA 2050]KAJ2728191.1 hypothetical protein IW152_006043 [Coemansia sp. BCRC 34962]